MRKITPGLVDRAGRILGFACVIIFCIFSILDREYYVCDPDGQGYVMLAKSFSHFELPAWEEDYFQYRSYVYVETVSGKVTAKYNIGYPLFLAVGYMLSGHQIAPWINAIISAIGSLAFYLLALELFGGAAAFCCTLIWLTSSGHLTFLPFPSHISSNITFVLLAFLFTCRWARTSCRLDALLAGFCTGLMTLVRVSNVLLYPALILILLLLGKKENRGKYGISFKSWEIYLVSLSIPILFLSIYNTLQFGLPWLTGYSLTGESTAYDFSVLLSRVPGIFKMRNSLLDDWPWFLCLFGMAYGLFSKPKTVLIFIVWGLPTFCFFGSYYWYVPWGIPYTRFFLPVLPGVVLSLGFLFMDVQKRFQIQGAVALSVIVLLGWISRETFDGLKYTLFLANLLPVCIVLFCSFLIKELRQGYIIHCVLILALIIWVCWNPPHRALRFRETYYPKERCARALEIERYMQPGTVVYAEGRDAWHCSIYENVISYTVRAWLDPHYPQRQKTKCAKMWPKYDLRRHEKAHRMFDTLGKKGLKDHLLNQVKRQLREGKKVLFNDKSSRHQTLEWCRQDPDLNLEYWRIDGLTLGFWKVTF